MRVNHWRIVAAVLAAGSLSGCAAALIPMLAGGALATGVEGSDAGGSPQPQPARTAKADAALAPVSAPAVPLAPAPVATAPAKAGEAVGVSPAAKPAPVVTAPLAALQITSFDPAFARFADFALAATRPAGVQADDVAGPLSAMLADPVALDGERKPCSDQQALAVLIDLDPAGGQFNEPARLPDLPEHAAALAALREAGVAISWVSQRPITATGAIRSALEASGLDPRGQDVLVLARDPADRKQVLRETLAANSCIIAIAGDERADFDERFRYLRNPAAGARLETLIGEGPWFLIRNIFPPTSSTGTPTP